VQKGRYHFPFEQPLVGFQVDRAHQKESEETRDAGFESWLTGNRGALGGGGVKRVCPECTHGLRKVAYYTPILQLDTLRLETWRGAVTHLGPRSWVPKKKLHSSTEAGGSVDIYDRIKGQAQNRVPPNPEQCTQAYTLEPSPLEPRSVECLPIC
jgi:hypothetical protein